MLKKHIKKDKKKGEDLEMQKTLIRYIAENPEKYILRLESITFLIIIRKSDNKYINVYGSYEDIEYLAGLLEKHPILLGD